ncbi:TPA: TolC family protein [Klebsiella pneumoniae]|nr:TolC family protein [Klebsiella pneumoniae]
MIRPVALAIVLALVGCQSADVQRAQPTLTIPAAWRADVGPASPVEGVWWRNFHDSTLNQYVDQALRYNSDVLIARERVNEYQARAYAADSSLFPSLDASLTGTRARTQSAATGLPIHSTLYKGGLTASYDVDIWGANRSAANAAGASLEAQKAAADATLTSSQAQLLPSINLTATGSLQDRTLPDLLDNPLRLWSLGGSILAPLLNRQALNAQVDVSMAQRNQALYSYEKTVRSAFKEVNDSLDAISRYGEQLSELQEQETVAQETLRIAQNRYRNGYSSYLDVLDAQRTLFSTQLSVVQVKNNLLLAQIDLYRALGGGWSDSSGS